MENATYHGNNLIIKLSYEFALDIIRFSQQLEELRNYIIAKQVIRCGTSIGASVREAQNAESNDDFIHKMKVAAKESDEMEYWLLLCQASSGYPDCNDLIEKIVVIRKVLTKIIASSKKKG